MHSELAEKLARLTTQPGVYQHKDEDGKVLYVGKAKNLKARVNSYFHDSRNREGRLKILVSKIWDVEVIVTDTEVEALLLENNLIKSLRPRYNINLRDDKTYPYICIKHEPFPRVFPTRQPRKDGSKYFGPYTEVRSMRIMLDTIRSIFRLRTCSLNLAPEPIRAGKYEVCLQYHIKKCDAPCVGLQSKESYASTIKQVEQLLNGKTTTLVALFKDEMKRMSENMQFEEAAKLRDQVQALEKYSERQKVVAGDLADRDLFALHVDREENAACGITFQMRDGKIVGRRTQYLTRIDESPEEELMQMVVERYYTESSFFPDEVVLSVSCADLGPVEELLKEKKGKKVTFVVPQRGDKAGLIGIVEKNAQLMLEEYKVARQKKNEGKVPHAVTKLKADLSLPRLPRRIECFDISHLGGTDVVASCVVFVDGIPKKSEYRTFKVQTVGGGVSDDFQSMREVVGRRYSKMVQENGPWPDLVVIDGGKGQLSSAVLALDEVEAYGKFPVVGLAKRLEEVFFPGDTESVIIPKDSASLQLLQRTRNEAHRFAVTFQRKQRTKSTLQNELEEIEGIGPKTAKKLIRVFGSVKRVREAPVDDLSREVGTHLAHLIVNHFGKSKAKNADS
ncbi:MAG: excinuclease ABC subunit UvrC [Bacteroidetes bacterium]|nr:excinuclease ABC subunit UvrC [Bacteroidota bacterium]